MNFEQFLNTSRTQIKSHLADFLQEKKSEDLPAMFKSLKLIETLEDFVQRGKLLRGTLFLFMTEALGGRIEKKHYDIACAIELMHSALLIQDDIIDQDRVRRGSDTVYTLYEKEGEKIGAFDPHHYGVSTAVVAADVAFFFAIELLSEWNEANLSQLLKKYAHEVYLVAVAEGVDSVFGQTQHEPEKDEILAVYKYKTARYTFSLPFELAAIALSADEATQDSLRSLGEGSGIIFQMKDDEIGLFGDENVIGKPVGGDLRENKKTVLRHLLYQYANEDEKQTLNECFGNPNAGGEHIEKVKIIYEKYELSGIIKDEIHRIMERVWEDFNALQIKPESKEILKELLDYNLKRSY